MITITPCAEQLCGDHQRSHAPEGDRGPQQQVRSEDGTAQVRQGTKNQDVGTRRCYLPIH